MFWVKPLRSHCGPLLKASATCTNKHKSCCYLPCSLSLVYNELHNVCGWHCNACSGHFHCVQVCFCNLVSFLVNLVFFHHEIWYFSVTTEWQHWFCRMWPCSAPTEDFFHLDLFFSRPGCLGLIIKNRVKSVFWSDKLISNFNVFHNIKITLHYSVHMCTSGEKVLISDEAERVQSVSYSPIRSLSRLYIVVCLGEGKRRTCLGPPSRYFARKHSSFLVKNLLSAHIMFSE